MTCYVMRMLVSVYHKTRYDLFICWYTLIALDANAGKNNSSPLLQALDTVLVARGYNKVQQKLPIYCIGDGRDIEVSLECDSLHVRRMPSTQVSKV